MYGNENSVDFAKYILRKAQENGITIDQKTHDGRVKLQKLLFICYGIFLAELNDTLFDTLPIARREGPLFKAVHTWQTMTRDNDINELLTDERYNEIEQDYACFSDTVLKLVGERTGKELSDWSHDELKSWKEAKEMNELDLYSIQKDFNFIDNIIKIKNTSLSDTDFEEIMAELTTSIDHKYLF
jgi:uncharacterized phage-associated protein